MATDICLPVSKFSHATGVRHDNTIPWTHIVAEDLYVIIMGDAVTVPGGKLTMRVVQGTAVLDNVNLGDCIDQAMVVRANATRCGIPPSLESLPIFGLTKDTALAIRYRLGDSKLRMQSIADCRQLFSALRQRGLEFQDQRPGTSHSRAFDVQPGSDQSRSRLWTTPTGSGLVTVSHSPQRPDVFRMPDIEAGSLSKRQCSEESSRHVDRVGHLAEAHHPVPLKHLSRDTSLAPRNPLPSYPVSNQSHPPHSAPDASFSPVPLFATDSSASDRLLRVDHSTNARHLTSYGSIAQRSSSEAASNHPALASSGRFPVRPWTSISSDPASTHFSQPLEYRLPPRRELPFKRPDSRRSDGVLPTSRPSSSTLSMPPLPKPKLASDLTTSVQSTPPVLMKEGDASSLGKDTRPSASTKRALPMNELLWGTRRASEQLSNEIHQEAPGRRDDHPVNDNSRVQRSGDAQLGGLSLTDRDPLKSMHASLLNSAQRMDASSLEAFAKQSNEERRAALDAFMIDKLQDPNFLTLCEDVENCWRRIGFG